MTSRQRVISALEHKTPDAVPFDLGGTPVTGISAGALTRLRKAMNLKEESVKVNEPFQMLGMVEEDLLQASGVDVVGLWPQNTFFGYANKNWKPWTLFDGTKVMVGGDFATTTDEKGNVYLYPAGDTTVLPSGMMPKGGYYFDTLVRQEPLDEDHMDGRADFGEQFQVLQDSELQYYQDTVNDLYNHTDYAIVGNHVFLSLGDAAVVPGPALKRTPGIRKLDEWYMALHLHPNYIKDVYEYQTEIALKNLALYKEAVGDRLQVVIVNGADFGTQRCEFFSRDMFREFYMPYFKRANDWIHTNTSWKTFYHTCGSIVNLLDDLVEVGVDIINPVQCSAAKMDPVFLKTTYGDKLTFWGGATDTQKTLPFGTPEEVYNEAKERLRIFSKNGGFIYSGIHNIQYPTPHENIMAFMEALRDYNSRQP